LTARGAGDECDLVSQTTHAVSVPYPNRMVGAVYAGVSDNPGC
jgi:hypothetical protein